MIRRLLAVTLVALCVLQASPRLDAWGFEAHKYVTGRAIDMLPAEIKPFFEKHRTFIVEHSVDPDPRRNAGFDDEPPRHFVDMDAYGPPPFTAVPRDFDAAVAKHGKDFVLKNGTLPWRGQEFYDKLVKAFEDVKAGRPYALDNVTFYVAVLSHYMGDAHVPFHAALNSTRRSCSPTTSSPDAARPCSALHLDREARRHALLAACYGVLALLSIPIALVPGPNVFGYVFAFLLVGHFLYRAPGWGGRG